VLEPLLEKLSPMIGEGRKGREGKGRERKGHCLSICSSIGAAPVFREKRSKFASFGNVELREISGDF
jgi:hypothetical protein